MCTSLECSEQRRSRNHTCISSLSPAQPRSRHVSAAGVERSVEHLDYKYRTAWAAAVMDPVRPPSTSSATSRRPPYILQVAESIQCHYTFEIMDSAACGTPISKTVGQTYASDLCVCGAYNLNQVSPGQDITYVDGANDLFINPCGQTVNQSCSNAGASICDGAH